MADEPGVQEMLKLFGLDHALQGAQAHALVHGQQVAGGLHALLKPVLLLRDLDVHVLGADFAAVSLTEGFDNIAEGGELLLAIGQL